MNTPEILKNIAQRCGGDIYLGIVGPVRVGKSTFIKGFMEKAVIPYVNDEYEKEFIEFKKKNAELKEKVSNGKLTQEEYMKWLNEQ